MEEPSILKHFSHDHPLQSIESNSDENQVCSACKHAINSSFYHCEICRFYLHKVCYTLPKKMMHPADPNHCLTLFTSPLDDEESNECKACGRYIAGFYYSCNKCSLYYHMLCSAMPLSIKIPSSHPHILKLELESRDFTCDICGRPSHHAWHYRCKSCEFDAHVSCAVKQSKDDGVVELKSHQHELMELLLEGMKINLDHSVSVSEAFTLLSCQFSDACFSLDINKCNNQIQTQSEWSVCDSNHGNEKLQLLKRQSFSFGVRGLKRELSLAPYTGICTEISENETRNADATDERKIFKDHAENVNLRRPFWSKILTCF